MKTNMKYIIKLVCILIVVIASFIFTYLTLETVPIQGSEYTYCRRIEFWCYKPYDTMGIYYLTDKEQYSIEWAFSLYDITVKNGQVNYNDQVIKTNAPDGFYNKLVGYISVDNSFIIPDDEHKFIGTVR